jgi:hypothetical protein
VIFVSDGSFYPRAIVTGDGSPLYPRVVITGDGWASPALEFIASLN